MTMVTARRFGPLLLGGVTSMSLFGCLTNGFAVPPAAHVHPQQKLQQLTTTTTKPSFVALSVIPTSTGYDNFCIESVDDDGQTVIDPETARRFRRTVYTHDDWKKHRSQDRFMSYLGSLFSSGVYQNQKQEVFLCTAIAALICFWNALVGGYTDLAGAQHDALIGGGALAKVGLPLTPFTLAGSFLGLLLSKY